MRVALRRSLQRTRFASRKTLSCCGAAFALYFVDAAQFVMPTVCTICGYRPCAHMICIILELCSRATGCCYSAQWGSVAARVANQSLVWACKSRTDSALRSLDVSHLMLHSACVLRMCCGVGLSIWQVYLTTPPTSTTSLEYSIFYELRRHRQRHGSHLVLVILVVHYVPAGSHTEHTSMAWSPKSKIGQRMCAS